MLELFLNLDDNLQLLSEAGTTYSRLNARAKGHAVATIGRAVMLVLVTRLALGSVEPMVSVILAISIKAKVRLQFGVTPKRSGGMRSNGAEARMSSQLVTLQWVK